MTEPQAEKVAHRINPASDPAATTISSDRAEQMNLGPNEDLSAEQSAYITERAERLSPGVNSDADDPAIRAKAARMSLGNN